MKIHAKHIRSKCFRINIPIPREFLLSIIKNDFGIITFTNCRGEKIFVYRFLKAIVFRVPM
jgi:hypothetical protein